MTEDPKPDAPQAIEEKASAGVQLPGSQLRRFPGAIAIGGYMILLSAVICFDVVRGQVRPFYLVFSASFIMGALGLIMMLRWGWALTLAGVALMSAFFFWSFSTHGGGVELVQGLLNLVFFLYLVRSDLREKMR
jgi:uncharacterized membrane protein (DUF2068 family)